MSVLAEKSPTSPTSSHAPSLSNDNDPASLAEKGGQDSELPPTNPQDRSTPQRRKDGGIKAILTLLGTFPIVIVFGMLNAYGAFQSWYEDHQLKDHSPSAISWIGSVQLCSFYFSGVIVGRICDVYGPRPPLIAGGLLFTFSLMMTSISKQYYQFILAQGVLNGFAIGVSFYPCLTSISHHFEKYRATAMGLVLLGGGIGGLAFPIMLSRLFNSIGFGWTVRILGFMALGAVSISLLTISVDLPSTSSTSSDKPNAPFLNLQYFRDLKFMILVAALCSITLGYFVPGTYIVQYSQDHGLPEHLAFESLSVFNGLSLIGRTLIPLLADLLGAFNVLSFVGIMLGISVLAVWHQATTTGGILGFAAFYGIFYGAMPVMMPVCVTRISEPHERGARIGLLYAFLGIPALVGPPIAGAILERERGSFGGMIIFSGVFMLLGGGLVFVDKMILNHRLRAKV